MPFGEALKASESIEMDLSLMRAGTSTKSTVLSLSRVRKHVYSEFNRLYIEKRTPSDWKHIKIGEKIEKNDQMTKYSNIQRMFRLGERRFRLQSDSDSEKASQVLVEFGEMFGKQLEPYLQTFKEGKYGRHIYKEKWAANMVFYEEVPLDFERINKKWRRRVMQERLTR